MCWQRRHRFSGTQLVLFLSVDFNDLLCTCVKDSKDLLDLLDQFFHEPHSAANQLEKHLSTFVGDHSKNTSRCQTLTVAGSWLERLESSEVQSKSNWSGLTTDSMCTKRSNRFWKALRCSWWHKMPSKAEETSVLLHLPSSCIFYSYINLLNIHFTLNLMSAVFLPVSDMFIFRSLHSTCWVNRRQTPPANPTCCSQSLFIKCVVNMTVCKSMLVAAPFIRTHAFANVCASIVSSPCSSTSILKKVSAFLMSMPQ